MDNLFAKMKFNKIQFLQSVGLLSSRFDYATLRFERSWYLLFKSNLIFLVTLSGILKICISPMFKREDLIQLYIGSVKLTQFITAIHSDYGVQ